MSGEKHKIDVDELMTLYLDGEASQRQQTELKRMMLNDPSIADQLKTLQQQQQLLCVLPVEAAPETLIDDVRAGLERKLILGDTGENAPAVSTGRWAMRKWMAAAAMILVPVGLLSMVVWQIVKPPAGEDYIPTDQRLVQATPKTPETSPPAVEMPLELPFDGVLVMRTDEYMTVCDGVNKAIEAKGLLGSQAPSRTADMTRFTISASPRKVADLIDALGEMQLRCDTVLLEVVRAGGDVVRIIDPQSRQVKTLLYEDNVEMLDRLARRYAAANLKADTVLAKKDEESTDEGYPGGSMPSLAGAYDQPEAMITLTIHVERSFK